MRWIKIFVSLAVIICAVSGTTLRPVEASDKKPNILVIMGDNIGWFNASIYHRGIMGYQTPEH